MKFKKTTLPNGLRVITVPTKDRPAVTVIVAVETGSNYEDKNINGLSHFLEHMCFKGTVNRPTGLDITREIDSLGAQNNAFTGEELTGYYIKAEKKHFKQSLGILSDMYQNPTLPTEELEKEKGVILQEISMNEDEPRHKIYEVFGELMYGDTPAGRTILGPIKNIKKFQRQDFVDYRDKHYVAKSTLVIVVGDINEKTAIKEIEKQFKNISTKKKHGKEKVKVSQTSPALKIHYKKTDQTHLMLGFRAYSAKDKRNTALQVLAGILGKGMSSRLFDKLRNEMGVCYYVRAGVDDYTDHGQFVISAGVDRTRTEEVVRELLIECKKIRDELVTPAELQKVKDYLIGNLYLSLETSDSLAEYYLVQEIVKGKMQNPTEIEKEIRKVTAEDVQKIAKDVFQNKNLNLAILGDFKNQATLKKILKI